MTFKESVSDISPCRRWCVSWGVRTGTVSWTCWTGCPSSPSSSPPHSSSTVSSLPQSLAGHTPGRTTRICSVRRGPCFGSHVIYFHLSFLVLPLMSFISFPSVRFPFFHSEPSFSSFPSFSSVKFSFPSCHPTPSFSFFPYYHSALLFYLSYGEIFFFFLPLILSLPFLPFLL